MIAVARLGGVFLIAAALGSTAAADTKLQNVQITFSRTVNDVSTETALVNACNAKLDTNLSFVEKVALGSEAFPVDFDGDVVTLDIPNDTVPAGGKGLTGSAVFDVRSKSKGGRGCGGAADMSSTAHATAEPPKIHVAFRTDGKSGVTTVSIDPGFGPSTGTGGSAIDLYVTPLVNASLQSEASWKTMGAARAQLEKAAHLVAQDGPLTVGKSGDTIQLGFQLTHSIPFDQVSPSTYQTKISGTRTVSTEVRITIGGIKKKK
jgi:hypothetical protein